MNWGNEFLAWLSSDDGWRVMSGAVIPAAAILTAGIIAAIIGRSSTKRLVDHFRRDALASVLSGFLVAGRKAARWSTLNDVERAQVEHLAAECETRIRLLPVAGSALAASWASHQLESMKRDSSGFTFHAQQTLSEYRDTLIAWSEKPRSAKKLFAADLERWSLESALETPEHSSESAATIDPHATWVPSPSAIDNEPLTPEPPMSVAAHTGTMPLIITRPRPASSVRERVVPGSV
jgi:hypothetical protein